MKNTVAQTADEQRVVEYIKAESKKRGCKVKIYSNRKLKNTLFECADGEFSEFDMEIRCLKDRKDKKNYWIGVLVHEYCHLLQCYNEEKVWQNFEDVTSEIEDGIIFKKSSEIQMPKRQRLNLAKAIIKLELDCEKKAVNLLKQLKTNIDYDYYIACANVILYKYIFWAETGKWKQQNLLPQRS